MADLILKNPLKFQDGTGFDVSPESEIFGDAKVVVTFAIDQDVDKSKVVEFVNTTLTNQVEIDDGNLLIKENKISGSFTQTGNIITSQPFIHNGNLTIGNIITAEKIVSEIEESTTIFESGSTKFGDSTDDLHSRTGSLSMSGSVISLNDFDVEQISNDTSLSDESSNHVLTENAVKTYVDAQTDDFQTYLRKSFTHTGSFVTTSTASFSALTASAPTGFTATTEDDFMFFINGVITEHDALTIQQSGSVLLLKVNNDSVGYDLKQSDEIIGFGKFNS